MIQSVQFYLEVSHDNGDLATGNDQNNKHQEEEAKQVIELILPNSRKDEEKLNEDRAKGQNTGHEHRNKRIHEPLLLGDLALDLVRAHRVLVSGLLCALEVAEENWKSC